ncbi:MAG: Ig-like domain-containing protein, partial [Verrucomicrobiales bacterium]
MKGAQTLHGGRVDRKVGRFLALWGCVILASVTGGAQAVDAVDDAVSVAIDGKVLIDVVANDSDVARIEIARPPEVGTVALRPENRILYSHLGGAADTVTFDYSAHGPGGLVDTATVTVSPSGELRLDNRTVNMPATPPPSVFSVTDAFPHIGFWRPTSMESPAGDSRRLFISEREGKIYLIPNTGATSPSKLLFLDISERVLDDGNEQGLKSFALHPDFANNGYFYVC